MGWKVAYRKDAFEEELTDPKRVRPRLIKKYRALKDMAKLIPEGFRTSRKVDPNKLRTRAALRGEGIQSRS